MAAHRSLLAIALLSALPLLAGCGSDDDAQVLPAPTPGTLKFNFSTTNGVRASPNLVDPLRGTAYGAIFFERDVSLMGPRDGAPEATSIELANVDLTTADVSANSVVTIPIFPDKYVFLGMLDLDANGAVERRPESGDLATLPTTNQFTVESGTETEVTIVFDLVFN